MKTTFLVLLLATGVASAAVRSLGHLPTGQPYIKDEIEFCLKADVASALSSTGLQRRRVDVARIAALHPAVSAVIGNHLAAANWLRGEPLPAAIRAGGNELPAMARTLTALLVPGADAAEVVVALRKHPDVEWASLNTLEAPTYEPNDSQWSNQWAPRRILATNAWEIAQASTNLRVAVVDTGVDLTHPDLASRIVYQKGFAGNASGDAMRDARGGASIDHGTHVAGIVAAIRDNNLGIAGIAQLGIMAMGCAVWDGTNQYLIGSETDAINDAIANGASVINCSFAQAVPVSAAMQSALDSARNAGVIVVCAAGNDGTNILASPSSAGWTAHTWPIIVSNTQEGANDTLHPSSNYGSAITLAAPGTAILSTVTTNFQTPSAGGTYSLMTGTSMAAPHVAGAAGMVRSMNPTRITGTGVRDLLIRMAQDRGTPGFDTNCGFGMTQLPLSFLGALKAATTFAGTNSNIWLTDGSYELPYPTIPDAIRFTVAGGTVILNGGVSGITPSYPAQTISSPVTLNAFPDRPVTIGN